MLLKQFSMINLGCNKNLVDSQHILARLIEKEAKNLMYNPDPYDDEVQFVVLNTCGFISSARDEMKAVIYELIDSNKKIIVFGCWVQYYEKLVKSGEEEILNHPNVLKMSREDIKKLDFKIMEKWYNSHIFGDFQRGESPRAYTNAQLWFEYLKIAEWCNNECKFCIIPQIRGNLTSRSIESVLDEVKTMINSWIKEIIFLSQDSGRYWLDLYGKPSLFKLLEKVEEIQWDFMYRVLYLYPDVVSLKHLEKLTKFEKFIPYFDIPLQHISSNVLKRMGRFYDEEYIYKFLDFIKDNFPQRYVRTNIIVWYPWESEDDFERLKDFLKLGYFDNIALFEYFDEPLAASSKLDQKLSDEVISSRTKELRKIVDNILDKKVSNNNEDNWWFVEDIIQDVDEDILIIRPWLHAPEIDLTISLTFDEVKWVLNESWEVNIGDRVVY